MATNSGSGAIWDVEQALRRMEDRHYDRYRDTYRRVAVIGNALAGLTFNSLYRDPARAVLAAVRANVERPGMVSEKLLTGPEQQACLSALQALDTALASEAPDLDLYALCTQPGAQFPNLIPLFQTLGDASQLVCVPFVQPGHNPQDAQVALDGFLGLVGDSRTLIDLYEHAPSVAWKPAFNRVMVAARRAGLLVELRGIRKPAAAGYISDPADDRWDVRSCVAPENAILFKEVHLKINTMAYLMDDLTYGDFFDLPMIDAKVLPHFKARIAADNGYWFTALEKERLIAAIDALVAFLGGSGINEGLTLREVYSRPDVPTEVLVQFQRMLDVKPELCLPFMNYTWDPVEAGAAIDVFLTGNRDRSLKQLYTDPPAPVKEVYTQSEYELILNRREATKVLLSKTNDLYCESPDNCVFFEYEWCSTSLYGNCRP